MSTPLKHLIKENAVAALKLITTANGYNQTVDDDAVVDHRPYEPTPPKYPYLYCWWEEMGNDNNLIVSHSVKTLTLMVGIKTANNDDPELALDQLEADVEKALMVDRQRGGYAIDTIFEDGDSDWRPPGYDPTGASYLTFRVLYRHKVGNPYSQ